jgi:hypothetical protein
MQELSNVPWQIVVSGIQSDDITLGSGLGFQYEHGGHWYRTEMPAGTGVYEFCFYWHLAQFNNSIDHQTIL